ncbi:MAG: serine hydrolase [Alphaproteobacteria bacterium]|nr:serine hydrolase [Alphaproteobacteria bacterium]
MHGLTRRNLLAMTALTAGVPDLAAAGPAGVSRVPLTPGALRRRLEAAADGAAFNGVLLLLERGRPVVARATGVADPATGRANAPDTRFNIASVGKLFTALAVLRLVEAGRLTPDSRLIDLWPDYPDPALAAEITVDALLTHRAGLGNRVMTAPTDALPASARQTDRVGLFATAGRAGPAGVMAYSNDGYVLLGAVVERLTGADFRDHVRETIFRPLGMAGAGFPAPDATAPDLAQPRLRDLDRPGVWRTATAAERLPGGAAGGGVATVADLARFGEALRTGRLLSPALMRSWIAPRVPFRGGHYGYGLQIEALGACRAFGHTGGHSGITAELMVFPDSGHVFVQLGNGEVDAYWALADGARTALCGETADTRRLALTNRVIALVSTRGADAGAALADAYPGTPLREGVIDVAAFRAWHRGDPAAAERLLRFNIRRFPNSSSALWSLAELHRHARRRDDAIASYRAYLVREPGDADAEARIAELSASR